MAKFVAAIAFLFVTMSTLSFMLEGEMAFAATSLTNRVAATDATLTVTSTTGFPSADVVQIGNELICYTGTTSTTFTGLTRGCRSTAADSHSSGARVYNETAGQVNQVVAFNIGESQGIIGKITGVFGMPLSIGKSFAKMIAWDYSFLEGDLAILKYMMLYPLSAAFVIGMFITVSSGIRGIFTR